jgi:4-amino-4-deoxy-L-arabinose transferase-like glycosyltransferase
MNHRLLLTAVLAIHGILLGYAAWWMSPTLDEPAHIAAGLSHWERGDFSLYRVNPPLIRLVATLPALAFGYDFEFPEVLNNDFSRKEFQIGEEFVAQNGRWTLWLVTMGRWACIPFSLLGAMVCYWWGRDLFGKSSGIMACCLWCFSPMVFGHASLLTPDSPSAALGALACYTYWNWLREPSWHRTITSGLILGIAELTKTTLILFYPLWPIVWLYYRLTDRQTIPFKQWRIELSMLIVRMTIGLYIINVGYIGNGSFVQLKEYEFRSEMLGSNPAENAYIGNRFREIGLGEIPVPLPFDYVLGIDHQQRDFEKFWGPSYLRGTYRQQGWWYYYAYALWVKTPLGTMLLAVCVVICRVFRLLECPKRRDEMVLVFPMVFVFCIVSSKWGFSHHLRYLFPCIPFAFVWICQIANLIGKSTIQSCTGSSFWRTRFAAFAIGFFAWTIGSSLWHYPNTLAYFNEFAGGPKNGAKHLLNSNIDWGQDLLQLEYWISKQGIQDDVHLAFDNYYNPFVLEIPNIVPWPIESDTKESDRVTSSDLGLRNSIVVPDGLYAISVNQLYEFPWSLRDRTGRRYSIDKTPLKQLRSMQPIGWVGYSIRIYTSDQLKMAYEKAANDERSER